MKKYINIVIALIVSNVLFAQNPSVNKAEAGIFVIKNARIAQGNGQVINSGTLVFENGIIKAVGAGDLSAQYPNAKVTDAKGKHIYPGIISPNNALGLTEIEAVRTTSDFQEIGQFNPNVRSLIAYNTDSEVIPTVRGNGVLITQATPEGGTISGRSSIFNLDGWNFEDAVLKADDGFWMNWPSKMNSSFDFSTFTREKKKNENYQTQITEIQAIFDQISISKKDDLAKANLKLSALEALTKSDSRLYIKFETDKEAIDAIGFIKKNAIKYPVLVGVFGSELLLDMVKENNIPVLIPTTHRLPEHEDANVWEAYKLPSRLFQKGILVGMFYNESYWRTRNLPYVAGNAAGHGITKDQALSMITLNNAKILGIDKYVGSLEVGKQATFVISAGDILDMMSSKIEAAYIKGTSINLDDKQKRLSEKYNGKYGLK